MAVKEKEYKRTLVEREATCPGGGKVKWTVVVEEPALGRIYSFIAIDEGSTMHDAKDSLLLDVEAARWLHKTLGEAIEVAEHAQRKAAEKAC